MLLKLNWKKSLLSSLFIMMTRTMLFNHYIIAISISIVDSIGVVDHRVRLERCSRNSVKEAHHLSSLWIFPRHFLKNHLANLSASLALFLVLLKSVLL